MSIRLKKSVSSFVLSGESLDLIWEWFLCFVLLIFLLLYGFRRNSYLLWSWRAPFMWESPYVNKKDLNDSDNHDSVITHLKPDILECEVKWVSRSITMNKASGSDRIPMSYFKSWKIMLLKCCTQYASKFGKLSSGHRIGKGIYIGFHSNPKGQCQRMFKLLHNCTHLTC